MTFSLYRHQQGLKAAAHFMLFSLAYYLSFALRFNFEIPREHWALFLATYPLLIVIKMTIFFRAGQLRSAWRYFGSRDVIDLVKVSALTSLIGAILIYTLWLRHGFSRSIMISDLILTMMIVGGVRFAYRMSRELNATWKKKSGIKIGIIGAGDTGEHLLRELNKHKLLNYKPMAFFDDNLGKIGISISGVHVYGPLNRIKEYVDKLDIEMLFIAVPSANKTQMKRIIEICGETNCEIKTIPGIDQLIDGQVTISALRDVSIEDLLGRDPVKLDMAAISGYLAGKSVLVTGAAGSIGSEICRQVLGFNPRKLILFDQAETGIFEINNELTALNSQAEILPYVSDICDLQRIESVIREHTPQVVFHAAAYKHVPLMEFNPNEAIKNNVLGTKIVADLSATYKVERFVFISTDKAVNPKSVMGATKRLAELYLKKANSRGGLRKVIVRFGNVLDSAGSVIPIFRRQIAEGGPVTVTHPEMTRYFMTIPEATQLVLQAAAMGQGGEIFVLDMGEPVKILDLAKDMIRLSGYKPGEDIEIKFTGIRPGEKLFEELWHEDNVEPTRHKKIFIKNSQLKLNGNFEQLFMALIHSASNGSSSAIKQNLVEAVPEYFMSCDEENPKAEFL